jgi:hypothetical protein
MAFTKKAPVTSAGTPTASTLGKFKQAVSELTADDILKLEDEIFNLNGDDYAFLKLEVDPLDEDVEDEDEDSDDNDEED